LVPQKRLNVSDIDIQLIADELQKDLENALPHIQEEIENAVENLANATYASIISQIQGMSLNPEDRQDYLRALKYDKLGNATWIIYLDSVEAKKLEEGRDPYSIKDDLLASEKKVQVGSRAGQPWVRTSKKGKKYAAVPFQQRPMSGESFYGNLADDIKKLSVMNRKTKKTQPITKLFNDLDGAPIHGKVATAKKVPGHPNLDGLTKYQHVHESGAVSSLYMTFRIVHEDSTGWQHPGTKGFQLFEKAEKVVEAELKNILETLL